MVLDFHYISWGIELKWSGLLQVPLSSLGLYIVCVFWGVVLLALR